MIFSEPWYDKEAGLEGEDIFFRSQDDLRLFRPQISAATICRARRLLCLAGADAQRPRLLRPGRWRWRRIQNRHARSTAWTTGAGADRSGTRTGAITRPIPKLLDVFRFLTLRNLNGVAVLGASRGGIIAMMLAVLRPAAIGCAVLNDIGPVIETAGLARIMGYAGKIPVPRDWGEAVASSRRFIRGNSPRSMTRVGPASHGSFSTRRRAGLPPLTIRRSGKRFRRWISPSLFPRCGNISNCC